MSINLLLYYSLQSATYFLCFIFIEDIRVYVPCSSPDVFRALTCMPCLLVYVDIDAQQLMFDP